MQTYLKYSLMSALIAIGWRLAGQQLQAVQAELTLAGIQIDYIPHAEIRLSSVRRTLADEAVIAQSQLLVFGVRVQCAISARRRSEPEMKMKVLSD